MDSTTDSAIRSVEQVDQQHENFNGCCDKQIRSFKFSACVYKQYAKAAKPTQYIVESGTGWWGGCGRLRGAGDILVMCGARPAVEILNVSGPESGKTTRQQQ